MADGALLTAICAAATRVLLDATASPKAGSGTSATTTGKPAPGTPAGARRLAPAARPQRPVAMIERAGVASFGAPQAAALRWPLNRAEALACLDAFITTALPHWRLRRRAGRPGAAPVPFAAVVCAEREDAAPAGGAAARRGRVAQRPGPRWPRWRGWCARFSGWREYVRGIYWAHMPATTRTTRWATRRAAAALVLERRHRTCAACAWPSLVAADGARAPHPAADGRGQFSRCSPGLRHGAARSYLGIYIDAFEWVELPNALGMSQRADGGVIATKPYVSSAAYLQRMGDYCRGSAQPQAKDRRATCPFNALYWELFARHAPALQANPLAGGTASGRRWPTQRTALRAQATQLRQRLETLDKGPTRMQSLPTVTAPSAGRRRRHWRRAGRAIARRPALRRGAHAGARQHAGAEDFGAPTALLRRRRRPCRRKALAPGAGGHRHVARRRGHPGERRRPEHRAGIAASFRRQHHRPGAGAGRLPPQLARGGRSVFAVL